MNTKIAPYNNPILFDGNDLSQIDGIMIYDYKANALPQRNLNTYKLARQDKSINTSAEFETKEVVVKFLLKKCDNASMEAVLQQLKGLLVQKNRPLTVMNAGVQLEYPAATLKDIPEPDWIGKYMGSALIFQCSDPFGYETNTTTLLNQAITTSPISMSASVGGSYTALPKFTVSFTSVTGGTGGYINISNASTGQGIKVTGNFTATSILTVDSYNKEVLLDGVTLDYTGTFPYFYPGTASITYSDSFSARSVTFLAQYKKRNI